MFHESGEESLEQGHAGVGVLGLGGCGISSVVLLSPLPPVGFWHLSFPSSTSQAAFSREQRPSTVCKTNYLSEHLRQPLPAPSSSLARHVKCE